MTRLTQETAQRLCGCIKDLLDVANGERVAGFDKGQEQIQASMEFIEALISAIDEYKAQAKEIRWDS